MNKLRILIAEDHVTVREGLKMLIDSQADMETVGEAGDGRQAVALARDLQPDVVLMDISMPELNGLKASAKLKRVAPDIRILTLTRHTDAAYLRELLQAGVSGYVLKQSAPGEMLRAIRIVADGGSYLDPAITGKIFECFGGKPELSGGAASGTVLTLREEEVLRCIAHGYSNREIAERLELSVKTIESHKAGALRKLGVKSRKDIIRYAITQGWMQGN